MCAQLHLVLAAESKNLLRQTHYFLQHFISSFMQKLYLFIWKKIGQAKSLRQLF